MDQASFYCPQCKQIRLFQSKPMNHVAHILASVFLCGLWLPIWILSAILYSPTWRCAFCGFYDETRYLADPNRRVNEQREALNRAAFREQQLAERGETTLSEKFTYFLSDNWKGLTLATIVLAPFLATIGYAIYIDATNKYEAAKVAAVATPTPDPALVVKRKLAAVRLEKELAKIHRSVLVTVSGQASNIIKISASSLTEADGKRLSAPKSDAAAALKEAGFVQMTVASSKNEWTYPL